MPDPTEDLWPSAFTTLTNDPAPAALLKDQAKLLAGKTEGRVEGVVKESTVEGTVYYSLYLKTPSLGDYLFKVLHIAIPVTRGPANPFPITVQDSFGNAEELVGGMDRFREWLRTVLSSAGVGSAVGNLIKRSEKAVSS